MTWYNGHTPFSVQCSRHLSIRTSRLSKVGQSLTSPSMIIGLLIIVLSPPSLPLNVADLSRGSFLCPAVKPNDIVIF